MIGGVLGEHLVAEPQYLRLLRDVTGMAGDPAPDGASACARSTVSAIVSGFRSQPTTEQPCAASCRVSSRPMPDPPPVTTASFPANESIAMMPTSAISLGPLPARR